MIFNLLCRNSVGENEVWKYDNLRNCFYDDEGNSRFQHSPYKVNYEKIEDIYSKYFGKTYNYDDIEDVYISLGNKCNFNCKYCAQKNVDNKKIIHISKDNIGNVIEFLKKCKNIKRLSFNGGEPLVYWKNFKSSLIRIIDYFDKNKINVKIGFGTNGSLLTMEIAKFLIENKIGFNISYDGENSDRLENILKNEELLKVLRYVDEIDYKKCNIHITLSENTGKISDIINEVEDKIGKNIKVIVGNVFMNFSKDASCYKGNERFKDNIRNLLKNEKIYNFHKGILGRYTLFKKNVISGEGFRYNSCPFSIGRKVTINFNCDILRCPQVPDSILGKDLEKTELPINKEKNLYICEKCPYLSVCGNSNCPPNFDDVNCNRIKEVNFIFFETLMMELFGVKLIKFLK